MTFPEMAETADMRSCDSSGEETPLAVHHFPGKCLFPPWARGGAREGETSDKQNQPCSPPAQKIDQSMNQIEASDTASTPKQPGPFRKQLPRWLKTYNTPVPRRSATPMPVQKSLADTFPGRVHQTPSVPRSNAPSLSDRSVTVRSQSHDHQDNLVQPSKPPRNSSLSNDEKSLAQIHMFGISTMLPSDAISSIENNQSARSPSSNQEVIASSSDNSFGDPVLSDRRMGSSDLSPTVEQFRSTDLNGPNEKHLPNMRSPSWSPLTTPPESPLAPMTDIIDEDVDCRGTSPQQTLPAGRQPCNRIFDSRTVVQQEELNNYPPRTPSPQRSGKPKPRNSRSRVKVRNVRGHANGGRRQAAPTRWSPVIPWSPNRKASFHYDVQQRLAAATRGTHIDNGLLKVTPEYFDM
ncbi:hypothetical protein LZ30DRAFT_794540 [Colletotrichum cereale]|nr:hypothetical protein LZ30DRAFT_794540 [Colletotrichum cereale]